MTCPTTKGWAYGETVYVGHQYTGYDACQSAIAWKKLHQQGEDADHEVHVLSYDRIEFRFEHVDPDVMRMLFGG